MPLILDLQRHYEDAKNDPEFKAELEHLNTHYTGRRRRSILPSG